MDDSKIKPKLEPCFEVPDWEHSPKKKHKKNHVDKSAILEVLFNTRGKIEREKKKIS